MGDQTIDSITSMPRLRLPPSCGSTVMKKTSLVAVREEPHVGLRGARIIDYLYESSGAVISRHVHSASSIAFLLTTENRLHKLERDRHCNWRKWKVFGKK